MGFNFGGNTGLSYDEIKRKRALLAGQVRQTASPNNFGQGLSAVGAALALEFFEKAATLAMNARPVVGFQAGLANLIYRLNGN